ncbi:Stk1 family PASTA domain-containing Ser/Thr kinase [Corynebacterium glyciniphilum]|uniref:Stk1 family PASTA domain-containing Ser/Thr kinase n=1 Tax=Corynebacterium glyciniphilum TaxID=1404244 RepID=UPI0011AB6923|nr:Stk1 family PASTA domain-containing Ser/Thr kinase [Corynebacterium glyciniphilum]
MDLSNTRLGGRYLLGPIIGTGGMSDVYAATDELLGRDIAVKMMRADLARDDTFLERFRREAKNAAKLNHHAIVAVYDTGQTDEAHGSVPYIVMERVHGQTLRDIVRDSGAFPLDEASRVMAEVCRALGFSHEAGIIHRDIKPANIMITNTGAVKVMDFGIARALSDTSSAMTQTAAVIGTAQYLSPEQARGKSAEARSDIYAAGCVFYEITTGQPPFSGESPFSVAFQHVQETPLPPSQVQGMDLDPDPALALDAVTLTAMAKDPSDRYDSSADMAADLQRMAEGRMPLAAQAYTDEPVHEATTTHMPAAAAVPAATPAPEAEPEAPRKEKKPRRGWVVALWIIAILALVGGGTAVAWNWFSGDDDTGQTSEQVQIPDVSGQPRDEAMSALEDAGFDVTVEDRADAEIPRDETIGTEPGADSFVPSGSQVTLLVSSGQEVTDVPDLTGMTTQQAQQALEDAGLRLRSNVSEQASESVDEGQVIEQTHPSGSQVSRGTEVGITVSTGPEDVRVPRVTGQSRDDAVQNLEDAGFEVDVSMVDSSEDENRVLSASNEGTTQPRGTTITIEVSRGNQFTMPQLVGKDYDEVYSTLQQAGWRGGPDRVSRTNVNQLDPLAVDRVVGQSAREGETIDRNAPITVRVNVLGIP